MNPTSIWDTADGHPSFAPLAADLEVDVAVIGGGITGITTAQLLAQGGLRVAVLEARTVGSGTTGSSAGNLYAPVDEYLHKLIDHWNVEKIRRVIRSRIAAIDLIAANVIRHSIDCDFIRVPWVLYAVGGSHEKCRLVRDEYDAARLLGLPARLWGCLPYVMPVDQALVVPQQAQFDPRRYVEQLAAAVVREPVRGRCEIYEHTPVVHLDAEAGILRTPRHRVRAHRIVMATHTPKGFVFQQIEVAPYREYAVAGPLEAKVWPRGIYWSIDEPVYSTRSVRVAGREYLLCIGQKHKVGQQPGTDGNYAQLQSYVRRHFGVSQFDFQWSAQHYRAADGLPYIGRAIGSARVLIATGFATDGLVYGTVAAQVIGDDLLGRANECAAVYSPRRFTPFKSALSFLVENGNAARCMIRDHVGNGEAKDVGDIAPGQGRIVELQGKKIAAYRDQNAVLHALSAVCTHLKCVVHWNCAEHTWDCPCHGSRFDIDGQVIEGPALAPLTPYPLEQHTPQQESLEI